MKIHVTTYLNHFGLVAGDTVWDEYEWMINHRLVPAQNIHHIFFGANKYEHIDNYMALSYENHDKVHQEKLLPREQMKKIHLMFLESHPYY